MHKAVFGFCVPFCFKSFVSNPDQYLLTHKNERIEIYETMDTFRLRVKILNIVIDTISMIVK